MSKKNILITGSAGFILGNYIRRLIYTSKNDYNISSIDLVKSNAINSIYNSKNHSFNIADLNNKHILDVIFQFEKPDIVIHGAAQTIHSSLNDYVDSNITSTQNVLEMCSKYNVEKFIHISDTCLDLNSNFYKTTKQAAESLVKIHSDDFGLNYNIIRVPNVYGPRQHSSKLIPQLIKRIDNDEQVDILDDGKSERDWVHVFDVCSALNLVLLNGENNATYTLFSNNVKSNIDVVIEVAKYMDKDPYVNLLEKQKSTVAVDKSNTMANIGWKPEIPFAEGIGEHCIDWFLKNKWFFKK